MNWFSNVCKCRNIFYTLKTDKTFMPLSGATNDENHRFPVNLPCVQYHDNDKKYKKLPFSTIGGQAGLDQESILW
ncbi:MAG: hypothetical protein ACE5GU_10010 [Candidatus Scalinduaceae bacterium]